MIVPVPPIFAAKQIAISIAVANFRSEAEIASVSNSTSISSGGGGGNKLFSGDLPYFLERSPIFRDKNIFHPRKISLYFFCSHLSYVFIALPKICLKSYRIFLYFRIIINMITRPWLPI